jgi:hypothetical protein
MQARRRPDRSADGPGARVTFMPPSIRLDPRHDLEGYETRIALGISLASATDRAITEQYKDIDERTVRP